MNSKNNTTNRTLDQREADHAINNYSRVPNMLVDGYLELLPQDKWLFVCLIRLCGKEGTRYLSLRYIAERTGFSRGPLGGSKDKPGMIQRLHNAGLIHAEIKRRKSTDGNEKNNAQYHITIADTWRLNYEFFNSETCPESGHDEKRVPKPVLNQDATCPKTGQDIPKHVLNQDATCPDSEPIVRLQNKITESYKITGRKKEPTEKSTEESFSHSSLPESSMKKSSFSSETKEATLSPEEQRVYDLGAQTIFKANPPKITPMVKRHCGEIAKAGIATLEQMKELEQISRQEQHLGNKPIYLGNLARGLNAWLQMQQIALSPMQASKNIAGVARSSYDDDDYVDDSFYPVKPPIKPSEQALTKTARVLGYGEF